uniref:Uncharacterized protein n=1 Tax=Pectinophora gossypiella TaxID=13191 RepID=A0A1E1WPN3_PECGO
MGFLDKTVLFVSVMFLMEINTAQSQRRATSNAQISSLLKTLISQGNGNGALQLLKAAAGRRGRVSNEEAIPRSVRPRSILPSGAPNFMLPNSVVPNLMAPNVMLQNGLTPNLMAQNLLQSVIVPNSLAPNGRAQIQNVPCPQYVEYPQIDARQVMPMVPQLVPMEKPIPERLVNPFLPAASPVSALAPTTSSLLPPADVKNCRCNFLRKIPIPPPTL